MAAEAVPVTQRFFSLDALRGLAAGAVVAYHVGQMSQGGAWLAPSGYLAVDFFFLLSGFVIARAYEPRLRRGMGLAEFTHIRLVRLYPLFLLGLAIGAAKPVLQILTQDDMAPEAAEVAGWAAANAFLLPAPGASSLFPLNPPAWSLFLEIVINLLFAACLLALTNRVLMVIAAVSAVALTYGAVQHGTADLGWGWQNIEYGLARVGWSFSLGVLFARMNVGVVRQRTWWCLAPMLGLMAVLLAPMPQDMRGFANALAIVVAFPILMWWAARLEAPRMMERGCTFAGDVSYPLYAIHYPLMLLYLAAVQRLAGHGWEAAITFLPVSVLAAWIALKMFDEPVRARFAPRRGLPRGSSSPSP